MRKIVFPAAAVACAVSVWAAAKPEISWSIMHPTAIDIAYMKRVVDKAAAYVGVDSFEVCGDLFNGRNDRERIDIYRLLPQGRGEGGALP